MKKIVKIFSVFAALSMLAVSCDLTAIENVQPTTQATSISTDVAELVDLADSKVPDQTVNITCDGYWIAQTPSWITVSPTYGTGNGKITLSIEDNLDELGNQKIPRSGQVVIVAGETLVAKIAVNQIGDKKLLMKKLPYEVNFKTSQDLFTIKDVTLTGGLTSVWAQDSKYGMRASAYKSGNQTAESWVISPEINLGSAKAAILSFNQAYNYVAASDVAKYLKLAVTADGGANWTYVDGSKINYGTGSWAEVNSGNIDLSEYCGKVIQFAFVYTSDASNAATWEIFDMKFVEEVPAFIALDKTAVQAAAAGDNLKLNVTSASTVWTLSSNVDWITMDPTTGTGDAEIAVTVAAGDPAEGKIILSAEGLDPVECAVSRVAYVTKTIAEVIAANGEIVKTEGTVTAIAAKGYTITDATGSILVYPNALTDFVIGDKVSVIGKSDSYNNGPQINTLTEQTKIESGVYKYPKAKLIDATEAANYKTIAGGTDLVTVEYVKIVGTLSVSSGKYFNLTIEDSDMQGSVYQATDAQKETLNVLDGKKIELYGMVSSVSKSSGTPKFINVVMTSAKEYTEEDWTVAHAISAQGEEVTAVAKVTAICGQGYVITDETGSILVYSKALTDFAIGDEVKVTGTSASYNNGPQISSPTLQQKISSSTYEYPTAKFIGATEAEAYKTLAAGTDLVKIEYVKMMGKLSVSSGKYFNIAIDGTEMQGSVYQASEDQKTALNALNGKYVELYGMVSSVSKSAGTPKFVTVVMTSVSEVDVTVAHSISAAKDTDVYVRGTVTATCGQGYVLTDETGSTLIYTKAVTEYVVGDVVLVAGKAGSYNNGPQVASPTLQQKAGHQEYSYPTPKLVDAAAAENYKTIASAGNLITMEYAKVVGALSVSSGKYFNITIDGTTMQGSVYQASEDQKTALNALNGKTIEFYGIVQSVSKSGGSPKFINFVMTSAVESTK